MTPEKVKTVLHLYKYNPNRQIDRVLLAEDMQRLQLEVDEVITDVLKLVWTEWMGTSNEKTSLPETH